MEIDFLGTLWSTKTTGKWPAKSNLYKLFLFRDLLGLTILHGKKHLRKSVGFEDMIWTRMANNFAEICWFRRFEMEQWCEKLRKSVGLSDLIWKNDIKTLFLQFFMPWKPLNAKIQQAQGRWCQMHRLNLPRCRSAWKHASQLLRGSSQLVALDIQNPPDTWWGLVLRNPKPETLNPTEINPTFPTVFFWIRYRSSLVQNLVLL